MAKARSTEDKGAARARTGFIIFLVAGITTAAGFSALNQASRLIQTSDSAQSFVAGDAIVRGNVLLAGWHVPLDDYYFTDTIPYAVLEWLSGPRPFLLVLVPALTYALFVCVALALTLRPAQPLIRKIEAVATVTFVLAAPGWIGGWNPFLMSDMHFGTVLAALVALALCARVARSEQGSMRTAANSRAALSVVTCTTAASDPFSVVFAFGPALALLCADRVLRSPTRNERSALCYLAAGTMLGLLLPSVIAFAGGFTTENIVAAGFVAWHSLGRNLIALLTCVLTLWGANPFTLQFSWPAIFLAGLRSAASLLVVAAVSRVARHLFGRHRETLFDRLLCAGILTLLAACALSTQFGKGITPQDLWRGGPPMRYVMPAVLFGAVLGARQFPKMLSAVEASRVRNFAQGLLVLLAVMTILAGDFGPREADLHRLRSNPPAVVAHWLEQRRLINGEGEYWSSNLITAMSGNAVHVRSVVAHDGRLVPYVLAADRNWYAKPAQFAIWQDENLTGMTFSDVRSTEVICQMVSVAGYRIAIFSAREPGHVVSCIHVQEMSPPSSPP